MQPKDPHPTTSTLSIHLLGPYHVQVDGRTLTPRHSRKEQWLLALLTLRHGRAVERDWLAGMLWPESNRSRALLRETLFDLRQTLGSQADHLNSPTVQMLRLDLEGVEADILAFDAALRRGDRPSLESAVALYRGALLEGCTEEWVFPERQVREEAYLEALEKLAALALEGGSPGKAINSLQRVVAVDPLRESAQRSLMQALAAHGDYSAAVQVYQKLRLLLHRELHTDPDPETAAVFHQIRAQASRGAVLKSPPVVSDAAPPLHIPRSWTELVGREQEVREVSAQLGSARLMTLVGTGGVGKTRLALQVSEEMVHDYRDGVWFVDLAPLADPTLVPHRTASALGLPSRPGHTPMETLLDFLQSKQLLLILDNCEHLLGACALLADALLHGCPQLRILATSRQALGLPGEWVWRVPSLSVPPAQPLTEREIDPVASLMEHGALQLFVLRARQAQSAFQVGACNVQTVADICRRLDGIPLAIELAAACTRSLSVEAIHRRMEGCFRLLTGGNRAALPRQQTLQATMIWSYELLTTQEKLLLQQLSIFAGGWTLEAVEQICCDDGMEDWELLEALSGLVDKSLILAEAKEVSVRYRMLETVRQYGRGRLVESGASHTYLRRHYDYFMGVAEEAEKQLRGKEQGLWLERMESEHDNLRSALDFCIEEPDGVQAALRLAGAASGFWCTRGHWNEGRERLVDLLARPEAQNPTWARAAALHGAATLAQAQRDLTSAHSLLEECLAIWRELGDKQRLAMSLAGLGSLISERGDHDLARALLEEGLTIWQELGDKHGIATLLNKLGVVAKRQSDYLTARSLLGESLAIRRELKDKNGMAASLFNLGAADQEQGDYNSARPFFEQSLALWRELKDKAGMAHALSRLGELAEYQGDHVANRSLYEQYLITWRELGNKEGIAHACNRLGCVAQDQGDDALARELFEESLGLTRAFGKAVDAAYPVMALGHLALRRGDYAAARAQYEEGLALLREADSKMNAWALLDTAAAARCQQDHIAARVRVMEALALFQERRDTNGILACLESLAATMAGEGQKDRSARLIGTVEGLRAGRQVDPWWWRRVRELGLGTIHGLLDAEHVAWTEGRSMTLEQAVAYALGES
ncbi:MAG: transcriptional activator domain protein [Chthonomonadaceae bacterium]|nr:transcriptional activator domain protein [Chthonomonadaceae bacterium]